MYQFKEIEQSVTAFWDQNTIYHKAKTKNQKGKPYFFLDGPPYTTGAIHIGHAWNKTMKDAVLRYKRMQGFNVRDQPGYDMHGLPIEVQVEKQLGIHNKKEIIEKIGLKTFIEACEKFALDNLWPMNKDFQRLGVWMDWDNPYMSIKNSYIEGAWWALKKAHKNKALYKGQKAMTWCARCATALAKHELVYENRTDPSIYLKFKIIGKENEYLLVWTTTPWTLAFNMGVMANPTLTYVKTKVGNESWILAKDLAEPVLKTFLGKEYSILEELPGTALEGITYEHPFQSELDILSQFANNKKFCTVVLSKEHVDVTSGTGLVHMAPGCGPEDYDVGKRNGLEPFNDVDEQGVFSSRMGSLSGLTAKKDDAQFIQKLKDKTILIGETTIDHEYAHCWRSKTPVIYRTTEQWFLGVERFKHEMLAENKNVQWTPDWAGNRWFDSWLQDLQDWCISRQRFWGIPLPIWECAKQHVTLIESKEELEQLSGMKLDNLHRPWIDEIIFPCKKCNEPMHRTPDVLDVWLDSGAAPWASIDKAMWKKLDKAEFILEGKDQIRGWFNSLICLSMVSRGTNSYKAVYMHGMIMDAQGRKMSKSLKNIISPYEVIEKYGVDAVRYYMIGAAKPGLDMNYNFEDMNSKYRNLDILWNIQNFVLDLAKTNGFTQLSKPTNMGIEEHYLLSKTHSTIQEATALFDTYQLDQIPWKLEELYLEMSRTYIKMIRDKASIGSKKEKKAIFTTLGTSLLTFIRLSAPIMPYLAEDLYQRLRTTFSLSDESIHLTKWPKADEKYINKNLELQITLSKEITQAALALRDKEKINVRWPLSKAEIYVSDPSLQENITAVEALIKKQANLKKIILHVQKETLELKADGMPFSKGEVRIDTTLTPELEQEGYARELIRRIQAKRKDLNLQKTDRIEIVIVSTYNLKMWKHDIKKKIGATKITFAKKKPTTPYQHETAEIIKTNTFTVLFNVEPIQK